MISDIDMVKTVWTRFRFAVCIWAGGKSTHCDRKSSLLHLMQTALIAKQNRSQTYPGHAYVTHHCILNRECRPINTLSYLAHYLHFEYNQIF